MGRLLLIFSFAVFATAVFADEHLRPLSEVNAFERRFQLAGPATIVQSSGFSGRSNGAPIMLDAPNQRVFLTRITGFERSDEPCHFELEFARIRDYARANRGAEFTRCHGSNANRMRGNPGSAKATRVRLPGMFVTGVQVCLNRARDKIKGVSLRHEFGGCVLGENSVSIPSNERTCTPNGNTCLSSRTGPLEPLSCTGPELAQLGEAYYERTNCRGGNGGPDDDWEAQANCPADHVAIGASFSTQPQGNGRLQANGIALNCRPIASVLGSGLQAR